MCGRFTLRTPMTLLIDQFHFSNQLELPLSYNIAPTQDVAACRNDDAQQRRLCLLRWGLVPPWAKDLKTGARMINARAETVATKPSFREAFRRRRCLVLADGYFEWQKTSTKRKQPYYIRMRDNRPFALAGLWEQWQGLQTCTVITTVANRLTRRIHDRMPVILEDADYDRWLDVDRQDRDELETLLKPLESGELEAVPVSTIVNSVRNNDPRCIEPATDILGVADE